LFVAFGQPKGEHWVAENCERLGVPVAMQIGATLDFIAGRVKRAPKSMQRIGCEWLYRFTTDPMRLGGRYVLNSWFATKMLLRDLLTRRQNRR
jgi:N-acetylglucosaminyldiphosphoundecaprenol N-acetyl-beta-D-mannosaminyltransferase